MNWVLWCSFLMWCIFSIVEGIRDAFFYHDRGRKFPWKINEHIIFVLERGIMSITLLYVVNNWLFIIPMILSFSFVHNGSYYTTRNNLDDKTYPKKWFDHSTTSTSNFTSVMTPLVRSLLFLLSICFLVYMNYL